MMAGTNSGCGKTTVTTAVLSAFQKRSVPLFAYKCGPDYIDPMFHRKVLGLPTENLDLFFSTPEELQKRIAQKAGSLVALEGVMGYFELSRAVKTPVVLVMNARGMYTSAGAILKGFRDFRPDSGIRGVIFNGVTAETYRGLAQIARGEGVEPLGFLPMKKELSVAERHLGLVTAEEITDLQERIAKWGELAEQTVDLDGILKLAETAPELPDPGMSGTEKRKTSLRIAIARDAAFCFCYEENLSMLRDAGAELCFFSPLEEKSLPEKIGGLYLPGGYPELYAEKLSGNDTLRRQIRDAVQSGLPTIAECGGFLYLQETLDGRPMTGVLPGKSGKKDRLQRFGYATLTAKKDCLLGRAGDSFRVHEFHYYDSTRNGSDFTAVKAGDGSSYDCAAATDTLYAGFPHLYFPACKQAVVRFVEKGQEYVGRNKI